jgi:hypothetical protein
VYGRQVKEKVQKPGDQVNLRELDGMVSQPPKYSPRITDDTMSQEKEREGGYIHSME